MSKLMEWLLILNLLAAVYIMLILNRMESEAIDRWMFVIQISPIVLIAAFGIYSVFTILYRTFTFNDCPLAAAEIQRQIIEARADLSKRGMKFLENSQ